MAGDKQTRRTWRLASPGRVWTFARAGACTPAEVRAFDPRAIAPPVIERWLGDPLGCATVREMCRDLVRVSPLLAAPGTTREREELRREFTRALERKELVAVPGEKIKGSSGGPPPEEPAPGPDRPRPQPAPVAEKSWIEIVLKDRRGRPVPKQKYRIVLPNGAVVEGKLDDDGRARKESIDPGMCTISFPDLGKPQSASS